MLIAKLLKTTVKARDSTLSWVALLASILLLFTTSGFLFSFGIFYNSFLDEFGDSKEKTAWVGSIPVSLMFLLAPLASWLLNKISLGVSVVATAIPLGLSLLLTSFITNIDGAFFTFSIPFGLASCLMLMVASKAVCIYFDKRQSTAFGLLTGGCCISQVGLSYIIIWLVNNFTLERTFQVLATVITLACLISSQGFFPTTYESDEKVNSARKKGLNVYFHLLKNKAFCLYMFAIFVCSFSYSVSNVHQVQLAIGYGTSPDLARQFPVFSAIGMGCGRFISGFIVDSKKFKTINYYQSVLFLNGLTAVIGSFSYTPIHLIVYIWAFSFLDGQMQSTFAPVVREVVGMTYMTEGFAMVFTSCSVSMMLGPPLLGFIVDKTQDYRAFFLLSGIPPILTCLLLTPLRYMEKVEVPDKEVNEKLTDEQDIEVDVEVIFKDKDILRSMRLETPV
ncbi:monocarboxylate transporter 10-like isoform X1 [Rhopilema esculentum]|uniref:monocarboxylate transporter 10-like isoform X1 n=1 Tax=Rhopilema esculentum TaxID=499914 RepID=UPI0031CECD66